MGKKKVSTEELLEFKVPVASVKKSTENIRGLDKPSFKVLDNIPIPENVDRMSEIKNQIINLKKGQCLEINNDNTGLSINDLQKRVSSIAFNHKQKFIDKDFITSKLSERTIRIWRNQ